MGKHSKPVHKHHTPAIERTLPFERIVELFSSRFDDPYLNPSAELTFEDFTTAFPDMARDTLEEALGYWTSHSGVRLLQMKTIETSQGENRVWFVHGLTRPTSQWLNQASNRLESAN